MIRRGLLLLAAQALIVAALIGYLEWETSRLPHEWMPVIGEPQISGRTATVEVRGRRGITSLKVDVPDWLRPRMNEPLRLEVAVEPDGELRPVRLRPSR